MVTHKYTLVCDEVRREDNGKFLVIGVYVGVIGALSIPLALPNGLTFFQCWEADRPGSVDLKMKIQHLESGQILLEARGGINFTQPGQALVPLKLGPLQFNTPGAYNLVVDIDGQKEPVIFDFSVQLMLPQQTQQRPGPGR